MPRPTSDEPTEVELQILRTLWQNGPSTARQIHEQMQEFKDTNYSTTVKMLGVMLEKDLLVRDEHQRPQVYRAAATQRATQKRMLSRLIQKVYDGSTQSLIMQALSARRATQEDLDEIRRHIDELEGKKS